MIGLLFGLFVYSILYLLKGFHGAASTFHLAQKPKRKFQGRLHHPAQARPVVAAG